MKAYIISIAAAAVISAAVSIITPEKWTKYVGIVTGLVIVLCIAQPVLNLLRTNVFEGIEIDTQQMSTDGSSILFDEVRAELTARVEEDAAARLKTEFMLDCETEADIAVNEQGEITGVNSITVYSKRGLDTAAAARLKEVYGASEVKYGGYNKKTEKPE